MNRYAKVWIFAVFCAYVKECRAYEVCQYYRFYYSYCEDGYHCCGSYSYGYDLCCDNRYDSKESEDSPTRLTDGAIAGIVIGSFLFLCCILVAVYCCNKKKKSQVGRVIHVQQPDGDGVAYISSGYYPRQEHPPQYYPQQQNKQPVHGAGFRSLAPVCSPCLKYSTALPGNL